MYKISVNPQIHFGKPCIEGTRITVQSVLELLNEGLSFSIIIQDYYPDLQLNSCRLNNEISSRSRRLRNHCEISD